MLELIESLSLLDSLLGRHSSFFKHCHEDPHDIEIAAGAASGQSKSCHSVGGMLMTNLGAVDANATMGYVTGDLKGAIGASILNIETENNGATPIFAVQHH
jgi:hypothetical protein